MQRHTICGQRLGKIGAFSLSAYTGKRDKPGKAPRTIFHDILWILKTGAPWRDMPEKLGAWQTVCKYFNKWAKLALWQDMLAFSIQEQTLSGFVLTTLMSRHINIQEVPGNKEGCQAIGRSRGGLMFENPCCRRCFGKPCDGTSYRRPNTRQCGCHGTF